VVDNDPQALHVLQSLNVEIIAADLNDENGLAPLQGQRFDAILACDVLEHLHQPQALLRRLPEYLEPTGRLVISIPNIAYAGVVAALRIGVFDYTEKGQLDHTHVRFFTRRSMERALLDTGWVPQHWEANRVPISHSEFAWCWDDIAPGLRQELLSGWGDFDVYQWMSVSTPTVGGHVAQAAREREYAQQLRDELYALKAVHAHEHASLLEHQKAFEEAKHIIARQEGEKSALECSLKEAQAEKTALQAALDKTQKKEPLPWWRRFF